MSSTTIPPPPRLIPRVRPSETARVDGVVATLGDWAGVALVLGDGGAETCGTPVVPLLVGVMIGVGVDDGDGVLPGAGLPVSDGSAPFWAATSSAAASV